MKFVNFESIKKLIDIAINEDIAHGDPSSEVSVKESLKSNFDLILKESGVVSGIDVAKFVFKKFNSEINFEALVEDGFCNPKIIAHINGPSRSILSAERTALNFIQRMSGVSTSTHQYKKLIKDTGVDIVDTRKTVPGWRILDKYSVLAGGGKNHRIDLGEMVMIKDNHLNSGNLEEIVNSSRSKFPNLKIEVEVENDIQLEKALALPIDRIMLDNWEPENASVAVKKIRKCNNKIVIEISGGINKKTIRSYALCFPDIISVGSITHSAKALDISLELVKKNS